MANQINPQPSSPAPLVNLAASCVVENNLQASSRDEDSRSLTNFYVKQIWDRLKSSSQDFGLTQIMSNIEDSLVETQQVDGQLPVGFSDEDFLKNNINTLFRNLATRFQAERVYGHVIPTDLASYAHLQQALEDEALQTIWDSTLSQELQYNGPELTTAGAIKDWLDDAANTAQLNAIQELNLSNLGLKVIPPHITKLAQLQELRLTHNQISSIPDSISTLTQLQLLYLNNNEITSIPDSFSNLIQLNGLYLNNNKISSISDLRSNTQLQTLSLNHNLIGGIPDSLSDTQVKKLFLNHNLISNIPTSLGNLTGLEALSIDDNPISSIPNSMGNLVHLERFYLNSIPGLSGNLAPWQGN